MFVASLSAKGLISPTYTYKIKHGFVSDVILKKTKLYVATDAGNVYLFDTKTKQLVDTISLSKIKDFMGDEIDSKIFSIDEEEGSLLILSQDNGGYSRLQLYSNKKLSSLITQKDKMNIIKVKYIDKDRVLMGFISNDIASYNIATKKIDWDKQVSMSRFSDFSFNKKDAEVAVADESGDVHLLSTKNGKVIQLLKGQNVDNIFSIDFKNKMILTGGQDRRVAVFNLKTKQSYHRMSKFFVYGVGLSPSGKIGAYTYNENNNIELFDTTNGTDMGKYQGNGKVISRINFVDEKHFFINSADNTVSFYTIK